MKASELRIGNWVRDFENCPVQLTGLMISFIEYELKKNNSSIMETPIHITEKWLTEFGFKRNENDDWSETSLDLGYLFLGTNITHDSVTLYQKDRISTGIHCRYVHELQNLYFALTGKELEIK